MKLDDEYTPNYCLQLEAAYGKGMMSEGGVEGIEYMFDQISLKDKVALDIGSGLGGVAFYLAETYRMHVTGLEVNPWMVAESQKQTPKSLKGKVDFVLSTSSSDWSLPYENYDLIYSKGVLVHVEDKAELFQECHRLLDENGMFVITDWLSSEKKEWGENISKLIELENLVLFPESKNGYQELLQKNDFNILSVRDDSSVYQKFNQAICLRLQAAIADSAFSNVFAKDELKASIDGYQSIVKALMIGELKVFRFVVRKR